jgi:hypothetical protein
MNTRPAIVFVMKYGTRYFSVNEQQAVAKKLSPNGERLPLGMMTKNIQSSFAVFCRRGILNGTRKGVTRE